MIHLTHVLVTAATRSEYEISRAQWVIVVWLERGGSFVHQRKCHLLLHAGFIRDDPREIHLVIPLLIICCHGISSGECPLAMASAVNHAVHVWFVSNEASTRGNTRVKDVSASESRPRLMLCFPFVICLLCVFKQLLLDQLVPPTTPYQLVQGQQNQTRLAQLN